MEAGLLLQRGGERPVPGGHQAVLVGVMEEAVLQAVEQGINVPGVAQRLQRSGLHEERIGQPALGVLRLHFRLCRIHIPVPHRVGVMALADQQQTLLHPRVLLRQGHGAVQAQRFGHAGGPAGDHARLAGDAVAVQGEGDQYPVAVPVQHLIVGGDAGQAPQRGVRVPGVAGARVPGQGDRRGGGLIQQLLHLVAEALHQRLVERLVGDPGVGDFTVLDAAQGAGGKKFHQRFGALAEPVQVAGIQLAAAQAQPGQGGADPAAVVGPVRDTVADQGLEVHVLAVVVVQRRHGLMGDEQEIVLVVAVGGRIVLAGGDQEKAEKNQQKTHNGKLRNARNCSQNRRRGVGRGPEM